MHKDTIKGTAKEAAGSGNRRLEAEGAVEKTEGKIQKGVGDIKDAARDALKN